MGKYSRDKGIRFERAIATKFRAEGFDVARVLEYDGFHRGWDLKLTNYPVVIQCKSTNNVRDLRVGLEEAIAHNPGYPLYVCIHRFARHRALRIAIEEGDTRYELTWPELIQKIKPLKWSPKLPGTLLVDSSTLLSNLRPVKWSESSPPPPPTSSLPSTFSLPKPRVFSTSLNKPVSPAPQSGEPSKIAKPAPG